MDGLEKRIAIHHHSELEKHHKRISCFRLLHRKRTISDALMDICSEKSGSSSVSTQFTRLVTSFLKGALHPKKNPGSAPAANIVQRYTKTTTQFYNCFAFCNSMHSFMLKYCFIFLLCTGRDGVFNLLWTAININGSARIQPQKLTRRNGVPSFTF